MKSIAIVLAFGALAFAWSCSSSSAASPPRAPRHGETLISVKGLDAGRVRLKRGSQKLVLDLGRDISGCKPTADEEEVFEYLKVKDLPWDGDVLRVAYQVRDEKVQRFIYDRRNPDAGFQRALEGGRR